jgi:hypothetical protein
MNGLVTFDKPRRYNDIKIVNEATQIPTNFANDALKGNIQPSPVSDLFFSAVNIKALQLGIYNTVLNKTCGKIVIGDQSVNELLTIMRSLYLQESQHSAILSPVPQVKRLNEKVIMFASPRIISEAQMHKAYLQRTSTLPVPMDHGQSTSVAGTKTLENKRF